MLDVEVLLLLGTTASRSRQATDIVSQNT